MESDEKSEREAAQVLKMLGKLICEKIIEMKVVEVKIITEMKRFSFQSRQTGT